MNIKRILLALLPVVFIAAIPPDVKLETGTDGGTVKGLTPGDQVAWSGLVRVRNGGVDRVKVVRGIGTVDANGQLPMAAAVDTTRSSWLLSEVGSTAPGIRVSTNADGDPETIVVRLLPETIEVEASATDITYLLPNGNSWYFFGADGGGDDADNIQNGVIVIRLSQLERFSAGAPSPPTTQQLGARVNVFDIYEWRDTEMIVPASAVPE